MVSSILDKLEIDTILLTDSLLEAIEGTDAGQTLSPSYQIYLTPELASVIDSSTKEATALNDEFVSTEHLFLSLIDYIVQTQNPWSYLDFCKDIYHQIGNDMKEEDLPQAGKKYKKFYFFQENCSTTSSEMCYDGFDRYGFCCFIWDKDKPIIKTRRSTYPW
jgi:ATP-dependent Clp protease ATP-binding subunit ClpA